MTAPEGLGLDAAIIAERAAAEAGVQTPAFLTGYIDMLVGVSATGRRLARDELSPGRCWVPPRPSRTCRCAH